MEIKVFQTQLTFKNVVTHWNELLLNTLETSRKISINIEEDIHASNRHDNNELKENVETQRTK